MTEQHRVWTLWPYECDATMKRTGMLYVRRSFRWQGRERGDYDLEERLGYPRIGGCNSITRYSITTLKGGARRHVAGNAGVQKGNRILVAWL